MDQWLKMIQDTKITYWLMGDAEKFDAMERIELSVLCWMAKN
jgi:hypothetical protein